MKKDIFSEILKKTNRFKLYAKDYLTGANYSGTGVLEVRQPDNILILKGTGSWRDGGSNSSQFSFSYKFIINSENDFSIEHTRYGDLNAVYLCKLTRESENRFASTEPHVCNNDLYSAELLINRNSVQLNWKITGPKKNMVLEYTFY